MQNKKLSLPSISNQYVTETIYNAIDIVNQTEVKSQIIQPPENSMLNANYACIEYNIKSTIIIILLTLTSDKPSWKHYTSEKGNIFIHHSKKVWHDYCSSLSEKKLIEKQKKINHVQVSLGNSNYF